MLCILFSDFVPGALGKFVVSAPPSQLFRCAIQQTCNSGQCLLLALNYQAEVRCVVIASPECRRYNKARHNRPQAGWTRSARLCAWRYVKRSIE